jgi:hypothetical protein
MNGEEERQYCDAMRDSEWKYLGRTSCFGLPCGSAVSRSSRREKPARARARARGSQRGSSLGWLSTVLSGTGTALLHCHSADHHVEVVPFSLELAFYLSVCICMYLSVFVLYVCFRVILAI